MFKKGHVFYQKQIQFPRIVCTFACKGVSDFKTRLDYSYHHLRSFASFKMGYCFSILYLFVVILLLFFQVFLVQLRENQKDFNFQLHHRLSKFEVPLVVNSKHIFELFGLYTTCFLMQNKLLELIRSSSDGLFWRKSQNKKGGKFELRSQLCYYNCNTN